MQCSYAALAHNRKIIQPARAHRGDSPRCSDCASYCAKYTNATYLLHFSPVMLLVVTEAQYILLLADFNALINTFVFSFVSLDRLG